MIIVKLGGGNSINIAGVARDLAEIKEKVIVVHGANVLRDELAARLAIEKKTITSVSGYSSVYSDKTAIDLLMLAYAGLRNKRIIEAFQQSGINAIGLSGLDGRMIIGKRNTGIRVRQNGKTMLINDLSGKPQQVNLPLLNLLLDNGYTPVLTMPIIDENGFAINSENDDVVAILQRQIVAERIISLIEAPGLLQDPEDPASVVPHLLPAEIAQWEERVSGRMKRKLHALRKLFETSSPLVTIADGRVEHPLLAGLEGRGTVISDSCSQ